MDHGSQGHGGDGGGGGHITHEALVVAHGCHSGSTHFSFGHTGHGMHSESHSVVGAQDRQGSIAGLNVPTVDENGEPYHAFAVHISRHGKLDILSKFRELALQFDLIQLDGLRPGLERSNRLKYEILDFDAWTQAQEQEEGRKYNAEEYGPRAKPNGWYPGATGTTALIRQNWQVGKRKSMFGTPQFDPQAHTYLQVTVTAWRYYESCDFETKVEIRIISSKEWDVQAQSWGYRRQPFDNHQRVAIKAYKAILEALASAKPSLTADLMRRELDQKYPPTPEVPEGAYGASDAELLEEDKLRVNEDAIDDQVARDNSSSSAPATTTPSDVTVELED